MEREAHGNGISTIMTFRTDRGANAATPTAILTATLVGMTSRRHTSAKHAGGKKMATMTKPQLQIKWEVQRETVSTSKESEGVGGWLISVQ